MQNLFKDGHKFDLDSITEVDNGDFQGTLIFLIPLNTYQPRLNEYVITSVYYGSCSGCDTLQGIQECYSRNLPNEEQIKDYMDLSLHLLQQCKWL